MVMSQAVHSPPRGVYFEISICRGFLSISPEIPSRSVYFHPRNGAAFKKRKCGSELCPSPVSIQAGRDAYPYGRKVMRFFLPDFYLVDNRHSHRRQLMMNRVIDSPPRGVFSRSSIYHVSIEADQDEDSSSRKMAAELGCRELYTFPHVQYLRNYPKSELHGKIVMVRMDTMILLQGIKDHQSVPENALKTITYLHKAGAEVVLAGSWNENIELGVFAEPCPSARTVAKFLSSVLGLEVVPAKYVNRLHFPKLEVGRNSVVLLLENLFPIKEERANCSKFSKEFSSWVDIIINDAFSDSHKVLASTVGVASFTNAYIAGFFFEENLCKMKSIINTAERPYYAIVTGGNLVAKADALRTLVSICDGLVFVGTLAFHVMHALGMPVPLKLMKPRELEEATKIVELVKSRNIPLILPNDVWCIKDHSPDKVELFSIYSILPGWQPVDIGPRSLDETINSVSKCKKVLWIGPLRFDASRNGRIMELVGAIGAVTSCHITFIGKMEYMVTLNNLSNCHFLASATVFWEVLKGRRLPGLMALDKAYPFRIEWKFVYGDPMRPLAVDVGSGNGLFLVGMSKRRKDMNFLGLEMNAKLVDRCLDDAHCLEADNVHFIATDATSTFRSIVSNYPGKLVLVSMQCPNPDFSKSEYCWRMLRRSLVKAIVDMLTSDGKVFLQSDIEDVAIRMKREFMEHGKGNLVILENQGDMATDKQGWLKENPFGVPSDWERHVLSRGHPMYRLLLSKVECS